MNRGHLVGLALGLGLTALALVVAPRPATLHRAWARLRLGGVPGPTGVAIAVEPTPVGLDGPGPRVVVWHVNAGQTPALVCLADPPGDELGFAVVPASGGEPLPPARGPDAPTIAGRGLRTVWLPPGERVGVVCDLSRWVAVPGPGEYVVRAERVPLGDPRGGFDGVRCTSEPVRIVVP